MSDNSSPKNPFSRRDFLKTGALSALFVGSGALISSCETKPKTAKNIIFLVSDGMSQGTLSMADHMMRRQFGRPSVWISGYEQNRFDYRGLMDMASLDSLVTDSASSASSWGCGQRINNGAVNMTPDGEKLKPICSIAKDGGKKTGLVTTTRITHATPSGFSINMDERWKENEIAEQHLERQVDVLLGGGNAFFAPDQREDNHDLYADFEDLGYKLVQNKTDMERNAFSDRLMGIFTDHHLPYTVDHKNMDEHNHVPTLAEMADVAIRNLSRHDGGFLLQIEGGRVDHAAHGNCPSGLIYDQIAFDEALGVAMDFAEKDGDTLLIVTTDHGNANPGLNGIGSGYRDSNKMFDRLQNFERTNSWILSGLDDTSNISAIRERYEFATKIEMSREEAQILQQSLRGTYQTAYRTRNRPSAVLSAIQANHVAINWVGSMHTSDYVELAAMGPGSERLTQPFVRNTDIFDIMVATLGLEEYV